MILSCTGSIQLSQRIFLQILGALRTMEYIDVCSFSYGTALIGVP